MVYNLTKNERKILKLLLENSRVTDSEIASKLKISSQAVGMIRRKLEKTVISSYTVNLSYEKLGIHAFAIAVAKMTPEGMDLGNLEIEQLLLKNDNIIQVFRLPQGNATHILLFGFETIDALDEYFHSKKIIATLHKFLEIQQLYTFSHNSLIKNSPEQLFAKVLDSLDSTQSKPTFQELENFKRRL